MHLFPGEECMFTGREDWVSFESHLVADRVFLLAEMRDGLFLTYSLDLYHSINLTSGDFSIPCGGLYYRDGQTVGTVDQMVMAGSLGELFESIRAVGDDLRFDEFYFKNYSYGGPSLLVSGLAFGR